MSGRGDYELAVSFRGKNFISRTMRTMQREMDATTRAFESGAGRIRRTFANLEGAGQRLQSAGQNLTTNLTIPIAALTVGLRELGGAAEQLQIAEAFRRQSQRIGQSSDEILTALKRTSAGTVRESDLMLSANRAFALGVGKNTSEFVTLMEVARSAGREMGLSTRQAFDDLVTGLGRGSPQILDNLGIVLKAGEAQQMYAEQLGKTTSELTDAEKKQALISGVISQATATLDRAALAQRTAAEEAQAMTAQWQDTSDRLKQDLLPVLTTLAEGFTALPQGIQSSAAGLVLFGFALGPVLQSVGSTIMGIATLHRVLRQLRNSERLARTFGLLTTGLAAFIRMLRAATIAARVTAMSFRGALVATGIGTLIVALGLLMQHWDTVWGFIAEFTPKAVNAVLNALGPLGKVIRSIGGFFGKFFGGSGAEVPGAPLSPAVPELPRSQQGIGFDFDRGYHFTHPELLSRGDINISMVNPTFRDERDATLITERLGRRLEAAVIGGS